jgi:hypothetical protein
VKRDNLNSAVAFLLSGMRPVTRGGSYGAAY